jgi:predicted phage-related endonuclease
MSPLSAKQAATRATAVGASEVGALVGDYLHPYASPASIYARIVTGYQRPVGSGAGLGNELEPAILALAGRRLGVKVRTSSWSYRHRELPLVATADAVTLEPVGDAVAILEAKLVGTWGASDWTDGPPPWVRDQVQAQLLLSRRRLGIVAALIGSTRFELHELPADPARQRELEEAVRRFALEHLEPRVPPAVELPRDEDLVLRLAPLGDGEALAAGNVLEALDYLDIAARRRLEAEELEAQARALAVRAVVTTGASVVLPPYGHGRRWRATRVELAGGPSLRFLPSRPKDTDNG